MTDGLVCLSKMEQSYHFTKIRAKEFKIINYKTASDYLLKWSMKDQLHLATFSFNESYQPYQKKKFAKEFFTNLNVVKVIAEMFPSLLYEGQEVFEVEVEDVPCEQLSMSFFDRILDPKNNIVRQGGSLHQCFDDVIEDFTISDELRKMILDEKSENFGLYNDNERRELLFRLFLHLVLGGEWCQYEDKIEPYLDMAKLFYKDLVQVERNPETKEIQIRSCCLKVVVLDQQKRPILPRNPENVQNFAYLTVDPTLRHVTLCAHEYGGHF